MHNYSFIALCDLQSKLAVQKYTILLIRIHCREPPDKIFIDRKSKAVLLSLHLNTFLGSLVESSVRLLRHNGSHSFAKSCILRWQTQGKMPLRHALNRKEENMFQYS